MGDKPTTIDEYLGNVEPRQRAGLERIRALVRELVPSAEEAISYGMPTLKYRNRALVYFTASKKHMSFMPPSWAIEALKDNSPATRLPNMQFSSHWRTPCRMN